MHNWMLEKNVKKNFFFFINLHLICPTLFASRNPFGEAEEIYGGEYSDEISPRNLVFDSRHAP